MELSNEQRELLSAYLDGEVNASERALAKALLERAEAAAYFAGLKRVQDLAQQHGAARAPQNFAALVKQSLEGDFDGISRPTSNSGDYDGISRPTSNQAPIHSLPQATWRMPLLAAAAAIVMALSIFAYNALVLPSASPTDVALHREISPAPASSDESPELAAKTRSLDDHNEDPVSDVEALKKEPQDGAARGQSDYMRRKKEMSDAQDGVEEKQGYAEGKGGTEGESANKNDDKNAEPSKSEKWHGDSEGGAGVGGGSGGGSGGAGKEDARKDLEEKTDKKGDKEKRARTSGNTPAETPPSPPAPKAEEVKPPAAKPGDAKTENRPLENAKDPAQEKARENSAAREVTIEVSGKREANAPSLETDMLQVASVYGEAKAGADDGSIEIEVSEDQLENMLAALNKLAKNEATAKELSEARTKDTKPNSERARDYLPPEKPANDTAGPDGQGDQPKTAQPAQPAKKVKVIVRLK